MSTSQIQSFWGTPQTPDPTNSHGSRDSGRHRLLNTSSTSGGSLYSSSTAYKYRAGTPALAILPLRSPPVNQDSEGARIFETTVPEIEHMLLKRLITAVSEIELVHRYIPGQTPTEDNVFVLIEVSWDERSSEISWLNCAMELKEFLVGKGLFNVGVEIIATELVMDKYVDVVEKEHPIVNVWNRSLEAEVSEMLLQDAQVAKLLVAINVLRLGYRPIDSNFPKNPVTVIVLLDWQTDPTKWGRAEESIRQLLREYPNRSPSTWLGTEEIKVLFENGENILLHGDQDIPMTDEPQPQKQTPAVETEIFDINHLAYAGPPYYIRPGSSVSQKLQLTDVEGKSSLGKSGTIGPILKLSYSVDGKPCDMLTAVTNYHVIRHFDGFSIPARDIRENPDAVKKSDMGYAKQGSALYKLDREPLGFRRSVLEKKYHVTVDQMSCRSPTAKVLEESLKSVDIAISLRIDQVNEMRAEGKLSADELSVWQDAVDKLMEERDVMRQFSHKNAANPNRSVFGELSMGSSPMYVKSENNFGLDYALIRIMDRSREISNNLKIPPLAFNPLPHPVIDAILEKMPPRLVGIGSLTKADKKGLYKVGAATGHTVGNFSHIQLRVFLKRDGDSDKKGTKAFCVVAGLPYNLDNMTEPRAFADHGDSGSAVWNSKGEWVGLVYGGSTIQQHNDKVAVTYIASAEDIVEHIKLTGREEKVDFKVEIYNPNVRI